MTRATVLVPAPVDDPGTLWTDPAPASSVEKIGLLYPALAPSRQSIDIPRICR